jgi:hypothetical protein
MRTPKSRVRALKFGGRIVFKKTVVLSPLHPSKPVAPSVVSQTEPLLVTTARAAKLLSVSPWEIRTLVRAFADTAERAA